MKDRPLCVFCLILLFIKLAGTIVFGAQFESALRTGISGQGIREKSKAVFTGQIVKKERKEKFQVLYIKKVSIKYQDKSISESKIIVYDSTFKKLKTGDVIKGEGKIQFFEKAGNPGGFDQEFYYQKQGIACAFWADFVDLDTKASWLVPEYLHQMREYFKEQLCKVMGKRDGAVLSAMLLGDKSGLDEELKEQYQKNGIGHILAISGLHISFLGMGLYGLLRKCGLSFALSGGAGILFLTGYVYMIGPGVSSIRALIMFIIRMGAEISGRVYDAVTALSVAAVAVVFYRPLSFFDPGFLFSFGAILGILFITPAVKEVIPYNYKLLEGLYAGIGINLMLFPFMLYFYYEFPPYSLLLNIIVIPLMTVMLAAGAAGLMILVWFPMAGKWILYVCAGIMRIYETLCRFTQKIPGARIVFGRPKAWQIVLYYLCLAILILVIYIKGRKLWKMSAVLLLLSSICLCAAGHGTKGITEITMLDVGQGDGIFMRGPSGGTYFFDGGSSDVKSVGKYRIEPFLLSQGVRELDYVFLSHGDADHINGIEEMMERQEPGVRINNLVLPAVWGEDTALNNLALKAEKRGIGVFVIKPGQAVSETSGDKKLTIRCLNPGEDFKGEVGNESSMVLSVQYQSFDMLFTGDVEGNGEKQLISEQKLKQYDVLKVAHHGSRNSTGEDFLEQTAPRTALISAGEENRYGHPHQETLKRLHDTGCRIVSTKESGAVMIQTDGRKIRIDKYGK